MTNIGKYVIDKRADNDNNRNNVKKITIRLGGMNLSISSLHVTGVIVTRWNTFLDLTVQAGSAEKDKKRFSRTHVVCRRSMRETLKRTFANVTVDALCPKGKGPNTEYHVTNSKWSENDLRTPSSPPPFHPLRAPVKAQRTPRPFGNVSWGVATGFRDVCVSREKSETLRSDKTVRFEP